jgi:TonB-linked SusC/RagA family outer membrane protein
MRKLIYFIALLLISALQPAFSQIEVTGTVTDAVDNTPIPGVSVVVKGTFTGVTTNSQGNYTITVPEGYNDLVFSFIGMKTTEVKIDGRTTISIQLEEDVVGLDEVVVTALGISRERKSLGYAVESVSGEELTRSGESNVIQGLAAKAAGVQVISSSGTPGASSKVLIRGNSTFTNNNQPLIVIDGVPLDNSTNASVPGDYPFTMELQSVNYSNRALDLNPDDIESVTILKGPAAAALYGVRAGNGAIIYTTKRGRATDGIRVTYGLTVDMSMVNKLPELQNKYAQGVGGGELDSLGNPTVGTFVTADPGPDGIWNTGDDVAGTPNSWGPTMESLGLSPVDNMENFFQTGTSWNHYLSMTGGDENTSFRLSLSHLNQEGIIPNTDFTRTSARLTADHKLSKKIRIGGSASYIKSGGIKAQNGSNLAGIMLSLLRAPISFDLNPGGGEGYLYPNGEQRRYFFLYDNPYFSVYKNTFTDDIDRFLGNAFVEYSPLQWLKATYRIGVDNYTDHRKQIFAIGSMQPNEPTGEINENIQRYREINSDLLITADYTFAENWRGGITLGNNLNQRNFQDLFSRGTILSIPEFYNLSNAASLYTSENNNIQRTAALFFDANISFMDMIFLGVTGRNEWASTFGPNNNNFFYPSASLAFIFSELIPENNILSFGKVRYNYARVGINPPPYQTRTYYTSPTFTDGFTNGLSFPYLGQGGFGYSANLGNPDLEPEQTTGNEVGVDLRFLNGRINLDVTYYNQLSEQILVFRPIAPSSGFESVYSNSGRMRNSGFEIVLDGDVFRTEDFTWNIGLNFAQNTNEVLELAEGVDEVSVLAAFVSIGSYAIVGDAYGALYGTRWLRNSNGDLVIGANGLPKVDPLRGNIGNPFPDWTMGISNSFNYKGINFSFLFDIREGGDLWNGTIARMYQYGLPEESVNREQTYIIPGVKEDGTPNDIEIDARNYFSNYWGDRGGAAVEQAIYDGSWVRLREITLSYRFQTKDMIPLVQYVDLSLSGRNLWLSTDYPGVDPETSLTGAGTNLNGFDYFNNPGSKSFIFGLKVGI